jgi:hypothetical protein
MEVATTWEETTSEPDAGIGLTTPLGDASDGKVNCLLL